MTAKNNKTEDKIKLMPLVKFSNSVNDNHLFAVIDTFTEFENNLFIACIAQFHDKGTRILSFDTMEMKSLLNYDKHISSKAYAQKIDLAFAKFLNIQERTLEKNDDGDDILTRQHVFNLAQVNLSSFEAKIQVNSAFAKLFNGLDRWTRFSLLQYTHLKSMYSKRLYRSLKQYRTVGTRSYTIEEFRELFTVPESYAPGNIDQKILKPVSQELSAVFKDFKIQKIYKKGGGVRGRKLDKYKFTWSPENNTQRDISINDLLEQTIAIYYIKTNKFLSKEDRFKAIDRYKGIKLGTTKKLYENKQSTSYFLDKAPTSKKSTYQRISLKKVSSYKTQAVESLVLLYERLNRDGQLEKSDIQDLVELEILLLKKQVKDFALKVKEFLSTHDRVTNNVEDVMKKFKAPNEAEINKLSVNNKIFDINQYIYDVVDEDSVLSDNLLDNLRLELPNILYSQTNEYKNRKTNVTDRFDGII